MNKIISVLIIAVLFMGCAAWNQHMYGYDHAIYVKGAEPCGLLYYSLSSKNFRGLLDQEWAYFLPSVQARARYLADLIGYEGDDISCSADGKYLLIGVVKEENGR